MKLLSILSFLIILLLINCSNHIDQQESNQTKKEQRVSVSVAQVIDTTVAEQMTIPGELMPYKQVQIYPKVNGIVISETVSLSSDVQKDQILAEIKQDIPGMEFSTVKIKATAGGIITRDAVENGSSVSVQKPVYTISQLNRLYFIANVTESNLRKIEKKGRVEVKINAYPEKKLFGTIAEINPLINPASRSARVKIILDNKRLLFKPGMFGQAYFTTSRHNGLVVPLDAIVQTGAQYSVFCIVDEKAQKRKIEMGTLLGDWVEVMGDLQDGDHVVIMGQNFLSDGTPVRIDKIYNPE